MRTRSSFAVHFAVRTADVTMLANALAALEKPESAASIVNFASNSGRLAYHAVAVAQPAIATTVLSVIFKLKCAM